MGLSQALFSAISGLTNHQRAMDNLGNNLANVNTVAFKKGVFQFRTLLEQTLSGAQAADEGTGRGAVNAVAVGLGTQTGSINKTFSQGNIDVTGNQQDMAIEGNGYFVLRNGTGTALTRDGTFYLGSDGSLLAGAGLQVQGVLAEDGVIPAAGDVEDVVINIGETGAAVETTQVSLTGNLNSNVEVATGLRLAANKAAILADPDLSGYLGDVNSATAGATGQDDDTWNALAAGSDGYINGGAVQTTAALAASDGSGEAIPLTGQLYFVRSDSGSGGAVNVDNFSLNTAGYDSQNTWAFRVTGAAGAYTLEVATDATFGTIVASTAATAEGTDNVALTTTAAGALLGFGASGFDGRVDFGSNLGTFADGVLTGSEDVDLKDLQYLSGTTWVQPFRNIDSDDTPNDITVSFRKGGRKHEVTFTYSDEGYILEGGGSQVVQSTTLKDFMRFMTGSLDQTASVSSIADVQNSANTRLTGGVMGTIQVAGKVGTEITGGTSSYSVPPETAGSFTRTGVDTATPYFGAFSDSDGGSGVSTSVTNWDLTASGWATQDTWYYEVVANGANWDVNVYSDASLTTQVATSTGAAPGGVAAGGTATFAAGAFSGSVQLAAVVTAGADGVLNRGIDSNNFSIVSNLGEENAITDIEITYNNVLYSDMFSTDPTYAEVQGGAASTNLVVYDSLGNPKNITDQLTLVARDSNFSTWRWYADSTDDTDNEWQYAESTGSITSNLNVGTGTIRFDSQGRFVSGAELSESKGITVTLEDQGVNNSIQIDLVEGLSASATQDLDYSFLTQVATDTDFNLREQDGSAPGTLDTFTTSEDGVIQGVFSNGQVQSLARLSLALVPNENGLLASGENLYITSPASGEAQVGFANVGGRGAIRAGALEGSNVDLSEEFTKLITTQRGFQANTRVVTTSDEMLVELVNMKR